MTVAIDSPLNRVPRDLSSRRRDQRRVTRFVRDTIARTYIRVEIFSLLNTKFCTRARVFLTEKSLAFRSFSDNTNGYFSINIDQLYRDPTILNILLF